MSQSPSPPLLQPLPRPHRLQQWIATWGDRQSLPHALQRLGQYSLAVFFGSAVSQAAIPGMAQGIAPDTASDYAAPTVAVGEQNSGDAEAPVQTAATPSRRATAALSFDFQGSGPPSVNRAEAQQSQRPTAGESPSASPAPSKATPTPLAPEPQSPSFLDPQTQYQLDQLFQGGVESLVARAVGAAEGTRTPTGERTWAYYGHTDPGNGVHNLGTFSYQHGAASPEEADQKQLQRLRQQAAQIQQDAEARGITLGLEDLLNAIDLANQAPRAALSAGGYLDRLQEAYQMGLKGSEAILWARVRSYIEPATQRWNAPGLGNDAGKIQADQHRRMDAIAQAILAGEQPIAQAPESFDHWPESPSLFGNTPALQFQQYRRRASG
jgi:hypothetical protein